MIYKHFYFQFENIVENRNYMHLIIFNFYTEVKGIRRIYDWETN